ncbi:prostaglandin reductase 1-like [Schistocerca serialis cubense]|uniref:prostaglandin reductase 1-like n=1 Tax=Schistocerca serialis cubense TaxID=2023355 RepID=UPI00214E5989|nr:prostaglandin reductase 1-like [Schistocerca serialis cubense]
MVKARKFVLANLFKGEPKVDDFRIEEEELPPLLDGQILCETEYISVDPYQRGFTHRYKVGATMIGSQVFWLRVARIVESRSPQHPAGWHVVGTWGWRDRTVVDPTPAPDDILPLMLVPDYRDLPMSLAVGVLGMPGASAYFGLLNICHPKPGEVVVGSGAAGAVGSIVGQIARIKGCKVIGIAGSDQKVKCLKEELGFHHAFNCKTANMDKALKEAAPDGVDVYFDNVGGEQSSAVIANMRQGGRISVCGCISVYNETKVAMAPVVQMHMVGKELVLEGFMVIRWLDQWDKAFLEMAQWIKKGKLKYREAVAEGFENTPKAFIGMLRGENLGKAAVKV